MTVVDDLPDYGVVDEPAPEPITGVANPLAGAPAPPTMVLPSTPASFFRLVLAPPARVGAWLATSGEIEHRLRIVTSHDDGGGAWTVRASLRRPVTRRWVPVEIMLCPHVGATSRLTLNPAGRVHSSRRWFRSGHRALDRIAVAFSS